MYSYACDVIRVVDGDTLDIRIDLGFSIATTQRVRLKGLNADEHNTAGGQKAIAYVKDWLTKHQDGTVTPFVVDSDKPGGGDKYGRYLAILRVPFGACLNDDLLSSGNAAKWDGQGTKPTT